MVAPPPDRRRRLAWFLANLGRRFRHMTIEPVTLNGELGVVIYDAGERAPSSPSTSRTGGSGPSTSS